MRYIINSIFVHNQILIEREKILLQNHESLPFLTTEQRHLFNATSCRPQCCPQSLEIAQILPKGSGGACLTDVFKGAPTAPSRETEG